MAGQWPTGTPLPWYFDPVGLADDDAALCLAAIEPGIQSWNDCADCRLSRTDDPTAARIVVRFLGVLDASVYTPAERAEWSAGIELGSTDEPVYVTRDSVLLMRLNLIAAYGGWTGPKLTDVARHESGHALGLDHANAPSCMSAILDESIATQQPVDVAAIQALYGPPQVPAPVVVATAAPAEPVPSPLSGVCPMNSLVTLLETSVESEVAGLAGSLVQKELDSGSTLNVAVDAALGKIEALIPDATVRAAADTALKALVNVVETAVAKALAAAAPAAPAA